VNQSLHLVCPLCFSPTVNYPTLASLVDDPVMCVQVIELGTPGAEPFLHKGAVEAIPLEHIARLFPMLS